METPKIRIGKDFTILWRIYKRKNGEKTPYMLEAGKENYILRLWTPYGKQEITRFDIDKNEIRFDFLGKDQKHLGNYSLELVERKNAIGMVTVDTVGFTLVAVSRYETDGDNSDIIIQDVQLDSELGLAPMVSLTIDTELSETSHNAVANYVITEALKNKVDKSELETLCPEEVFAFPVELYEVARREEVEGDGDHYVQVTDMFISKEQVESYYGCPYSEVYDKVSKAKMLSFMYGSSSFAPINSQNEPEGFFAAFSTSAGTLSIEFTFGIFKEEVDGYVFYVREWLPRLQNDVVFEELEKKANKDEIATPDWNAVEEQEGYIKNRTHYGVYTSLTEAVSEDWEVLLTGVNFHGIKRYTFHVHAYGSLFGVTTEYEVGADNVSFNEASPTVLRYAINEPMANTLLLGLYINEGEGILYGRYYDSNIDGWKASIEVCAKDYTCKQLAAEYIPETIARKQELSELEGKKAEKPFIFSAEKLGDPFYNKNEDGQSIIAFTKEQVEAAFGMSTAEIYEELKTRDAVLDLGIKALPCTRYDTAMDGLIMFYYYWPTHGQGSAEYRLSFYVEPAKIAEGVEANLAIRGTFADYIGIKEELTELSAEVGKKVDADKVATINGKSLINGGNIVIEGGRSYDDTELREAIALRNVGAEDTDESVEEPEIGGGDSSVFAAVWGETSYEELKAAFEARKICTCVYNNVMYNAISLFANGEIQFVATTLTSHFRLSCTSSGGWSKPTAYEMEKASNKVKTISEASTDMQYPSAKAVYDLVQDSIFNALNADYYGEE